MRRLTRRSLLAATLVGGGLAALSGRKADAGPIIVVGGGVGGAAAAMTLARRGANVSLIERDPTRFARRAPGAFEKPAAASLADLRASGVSVLVDEATGVDWSARRLHGFSGRHFAFDRLVLAPGLAPADEAIDGLDGPARHRWPAAWGDRREARRLVAQFGAMGQNGHAVIRLPGGPVSHPNGLDQRALALSNWLAREKPKAQLTVLDERADAIAPDGFRGEWASAAVRALDVAKGWIETDKGRIEADVVNFIPAQQAGALAHSAGLADASGFCPCDADQISIAQSSALIVGDAAAHADRSIRGAADAAARAFIALS